MNPSENGRFAEAAVAFDSCENRWSGVLPLEACIALYFVGRYDECRHFESHRAVSPDDVENALVAFSVDRAPIRLLPAGPDERASMREVCRDFSQNVHA